MLPIARPPSTIRYGVVLMNVAAKSGDAFVIQVSDKTEVGLSSMYNLQTSNVSLGLVGKYTTEDGAIMKVRK